HSVQPAGVGGGPAHGNRTGLGHTAKRRSRAAERRHYAAAHGGFPHWRRYTERIRLATKHCTQKGRTGKTARGPAPARLLGHGTPQRIPAGRERHGFDAFTTLLRVGEAPPRFGGAAEAAPPAARGRGGRGRSAPAGVSPW